MGLDTTHNCWHGGYGHFNQFRKELAKKLGFNLNEMEGFGGDKLWSDLPPDELHILLNHSDCDGEIGNDKCGKLAKRLEEIAVKLDGYYKDRALQFAAGLRDAEKAGENVIFQ